MKKVTIIIICNLILVLCLSVCLALVIDREASTPCEWEGVKGTCVSPRVCLTTLDRRSDKQPECAQVPGQSKAEEPLICCTDCDLINDTSNFIISASGRVFWKDGRKARDQCLQYLKDLPHICHQEGFYGGITRRLHDEKQCHVYNIWGVGGSPPPNAKPPREIPYEAIMGFGKDLESAVWMTAGAIISDKFILTSGHGHQTTEGRIPLKYAALGVKNRKSDKSEWQIHRVKKIYQHPEYANDSLDTRYNDIALLELETLIQFNKDVLPACLPEPGEELDVSTAKFSSWKQPTSDFSNFTDTNNIMHVKELNAEECHRKVKEVELPIPIFYYKVLPNAVNATTQLCYGDSSTCLNVMGAPVVVTNYISRCMNTVVGVNAYGDNCGPAVFTKVSHYTPWIESVVWP